MKTTFLSRVTILLTLSLTVLLSIAVYAMLNSDFRLAFFDFLLGVALAAGYWVARKRALIKTVDEDERTSGIREKAAYALYRTVYWLLSAGCLASYIIYRFTGFNELNRLASYLGYSFIAVLILYSAFEIFYQIKLGEFDRNEK